jgi:sulfotransferase
VKLNFISGLPRSGSTLLAAVLNQNPRFYSLGMTSPIASVFRAVEVATSRANEGAVLISEGERLRLLSGLFCSFYLSRDSAIFDTSRMWCARAPLLARLFPGSRLIVMVREIGWVLDSFERLFRRNDMVPSAVYGWDVDGTVYSRTSALAGPKGVVGYAINAVQEAVAAAGDADRLLLIDYEEFCKYPTKTLRALYDFLGERYFDHDTGSVVYESREFDATLGAPGLHTVRRAIAWTPRETILPQPLFDQFNGPNFWRSAGG